MKPFWFFFFKFIVKLISRKLWRDFSVNTRCQLNRNKFRHFDLYLFICNSAWLKFFTIQEKLRQNLQAGLATYPGFRNRILQWHWIQKTGELHQSRSIPIHLPGHFQLQSECRQFAWSDIFAGRTRSRLHKARRRSISTSSRRWFQLRILSDNRRPYTQLKDEKKLTHSHFVPVKSSSAKQAAFWKTHSFKYVFPFDPQISSITNLQVETAAFLQTSAEKIDVTKNGKSFMFLKKKAKAHLKFIPGSVLFAQLKGVWIGFYTSFDICKRSKISPY